MRDEPEGVDGQPEAQQPPMKRVGIGLASSLVVALVLWGAGHVMIPPVRPGQRTPAGHYTAPCWTCHIVSESAPVGEGG